MADNRLFQPPWPSFGPNLVPNFELIKVIGGTECVFNQVLVMINLHVTFNVHSSQAKL